MGLLALLPSCYGGMMIVAAGLEMEEARAAREAKKEDKKRAERNELISKLPPEEQAIVRLTDLGSMHYCDRIGIGEWLIDEQTMLNVTIYPLHNSKRPGIIDIYDKHFTGFGYQVVTPPAAKAARSYQLEDYRVDLRMESPSTLHQSQSSKAEDYFDLNVRVYSPREAARKRVR